jgi:chromatin remodeling complex protein RSC6
MEDNTVTEPVSQPVSDTVISEEPGPIAPLPFAFPAPTPSTETQFNSLLLDLSNIKTLINDMQLKVKLLEKSVIKTNKDNEKEIERKKKEMIKLNQPQPSGFDVPVAISNEMCVFMNKPIGTLVSRPYVAEYMLNYISINKLQDMTNRKKINYNDILQKLLQLKSDEQLSYFNLQKYLNKHFN